MVANYLYNKKMYYNLILKVKKMKKQTKEVFKDVPKYEGLYQVSNLGRVKSLKFNKEKILKPVVNSNGYLSANLYCEGKLKQKSVHQIIAITFLNHKPDGNNGLIVDHIDNDKLNNRLENLQLISNRENTSKDKKGGTSKYTGVNWNKASNKWLSQIIINGKTKYIGLFKCELPAAAAYQKELKEILTNQIPKTK